jgi:hypothetical protein
MNGDGLPGQPHQRLSKVVVVSLFENVFPTVRHVVPPAPGVVACPVRRPAKRNRRAQTAMPEPRTPRKGSRKFLYRNDLRFDISARRPAIPTTPPEERQFPKRKSCRPTGTPCASQDL